MEPVTLAADARTAWAHHVYCAAGHPAITPAAAAALLGTLEEAEHAELLAPAAGGWRPEYKFDFRDPHRAGNLQVAMRTLTRWVCASPSGELVSITGPVSGGSSARASQNDRHKGRDWWHTTLRGERDWDLTILVGTDFKLIETVEKGAGPVIKRLPAQPGTPAMPQFTADEPEPHSVAGRRSLPTDWGTAEELATAHLRTLGFDDATRTPSGRDEGIDVAASGAVAQVKMQALPVTAPTVQQLRGARPDADRWVFYSTSGYTAPALETAARSNVALFTISRTGAVEATNGIARDLEANGLDSAPGPWSVARAYAEGVADRGARSHGAHSGFRA